MINQPEPPDTFPDELPRFMPGQLVQHVRYGYRGVVVDFDMRCQADDQWYASNKTQPPRDQPWYHVLVHGSGTVTYAAQTSLEPGTDRDPIVHPLVEQFFSSFDKKTGRYERNDTPWPEG